MARSVAQVHQGAAPVQSRAAIAAAPVIRITPAIVGGAIRGQQQQLQVTKAPVQAKVNKIERRLRMRHHRGGGGGGLHTLHCCCDACEVHSLDFETYCTFCGFLPSLGLVPDSAQGGAAAAACAYLL